MENFQITSTMVDATIVGVTLISAILAYSRGFVREFLSIVGWVAAAVAALMFYKELEPTVRGFINSDELAKWGALAGAFVIALLIVSIITPLLARAVSESPLGPLDKGLGFLFGAARGLALLGLVYIAYDALLQPDDRYAAVEQAQTIDLVKESAGLIKSFVPSGEPPEFLRPAIDDLFGREEPAPETTSG